MRKTVLLTGLKGDEEMKIAGIEAAMTLNQRPNATGVSAAMMLFGPVSYTHLTLPTNREV